ncbi:putative COP9 signalosome complex subunit 2 [Microdochium trichocladiopsis]|uniref:COP9 signalosome complex subunit 2 n=1 Tax=Microdochium trichocladiopsis TaxID=1682393 RepID=A0A9P9BRT1_9PEZI|nr:putative COP9 signalosome complex subunit 2 [Microdochium trichocladiopsis]KAH7037180.1 putative COP9 signalosome complex subunit 2 [Microdochium trichocladiopsis]
MSDDDFMQESDEEQYDFEYEDDDDEDSGDVDIENKYYNAKQMKSSEPEEAIDEFLSIPGLEPEKGDWGFKGLKQAIKLEFKLCRYDKAVEHYTELLTYVKSAVTRNYSEKSINNMLDFIEKESENEEAQKCLEQFYSLTLNCFQSTNNERLWLKTNIKLAKLMLDRKDYAPVTKKLRELQKACQREDGTDDPSKGTYSLEIYALEIQMYAETRNNKQLKVLYQRALKVRSAVPHPKIMGIIRECGGKMHMSEENWKDAQSDFFESFRNYDEAGSLQRIQVLKYLLLTTMLMKSDINPFDSQETKPYRNDPRIAAMTELVDAYQRDDMHKYASVLSKNQDILADPFIAENIDEVTRNMRTKAVVKLIAPYTRMQLAWIARQLNITDAEVQDILGYLIVDGKIRGKIDQQAGTLEIESDGDAERVQALESWSNALAGLYATIFKEAEGFKVTEQHAQLDEATMLPMFSGDMPGRPRQARGKKKGFFAA